MKHLEQAQVKISMDGKRRALDNIYIGRITPSGCYLAAIIGENSTKVFVI